MNTSSGRDHSFSLEGYIPGRVSVIMNCLNCARYLREALDSVYDQTYADWEIILWDNHSHDDSAAIARSHDQRLRYFTADETAPLGAARNLALEQARGQFIAFLDCDDLWLPRKLETQLPYFNDSAIGLVCSDSLHFSEGRQGFSVYHDKGRCYPQGDVFSQVLADNLFSIDTVILRREAVAGLDHLFDPRFNLLEDWDFFLRISRDWSVACAPEVLSKYRVHQGSISFSHFKKFATERQILRQKMVALYGDLVAAYPREMALMDEITLYHEGLVNLLDGHKTQARRQARPYLLKNKRLCALYVASFLPMGWTKTFFKALRSLDY